MFDEIELRRAIDLQAKSYRLLRWAASGIDRGFLRTATVHDFATLPEAAHAWITEHLGSLPADTRPGPADLEAFANLFATYLHASFDMLDEPGERLYSPDAHCFCPLCSWLVAAPRLRPKKLRTVHKRLARTLMRDWAGLVAASIGASPDPDVLDAPDLREPLALGAYGHELLRRTRGLSEGPATLALWRSFAWTPTGSPKKGFELTADQILDAEAQLVERLGGNATGG